MELAVAAEKKNTMKDDAKPLEEMNNEEVAAEMHVKQAKVEKEASVAEDQATEQKSTE